jgi:glycosyltransferase involved in cell wall biosynthesis
MAGALKPAVLYISYDGMLEPLGQSQVIAYLEQLADEFQFHLMSFEKPADWANSERRSAVSRRLARAGIAWHPLRYHKSPTLPATLFDIANGTRKALWLAARHRVRLVHARSYIAGLIALAVKRAAGARFLFDIRGFWAEERTDGGLWKEQGRIYRAAKRVERSLLLAADRIVTLTQSSVPVLESLPFLRGRDHAPISVITTCADLDRFAPDDSKPPEVFTLGYLGSIGTWYLFDELLLCFRELRRQRPDARLLIVNRNDHELIRSKLAEHAIDPDCVELVAVEHSDAPAAIRRMTAGTAIIRPVFSKISSAPTKLAEYLGCGVPCLGNVGVGDMASILEDNRVGVALTEFNENERMNAVTRLLALVEDPELADRCRETALRMFSLEGGVAAYRDIYRTLLGPPVTEAAE